MRKSIFILFIFLGLYISCKKEAVTGIDKELHLKVMNQTGFVYYKNTDAILPKSSGSGHSQPFLVTYYDSLSGINHLDGAGRVKAGTKFAEGSLIVKRLLNSAKTLDRYAIMYKRTGDVAADENGWIWGYINADGTTSETALNKGSACKGCHGQSGHIDYTLMNKSFP